MPKRYSNKINLLTIEKKQIAKIKAIIEAASFYQIVGEFNLLDLIGLPKTIAKKYQQVQLGFQALNLVKIPFDTKCIATNTIDFTLTNCHINDKRNQQILKLLVQNQKPSMQDWKIFLVKKKRLSNYENIF